MPNRHHKLDIPYKIVTKVVDFQSEKAKTSTRTTKSTVVFYFFFFLITLIIFI